jgi:RHH-type proline utilization regulon transcriptional repressor/proline dehydrogenase/delta 1-pyrroline-5-carboxylate dehydrogenase
MPEDLEKGSFVAPVYIEIPDISMLKEEIFGPVLHVIRVPGDSMEKAVEAVNSTGYGLTFGIHSRIESRARQLAGKVAAGNVYVNRNMVGAVVGVQPFGGRGLSGTGPKAGGPHYLLRFMTEQSISTNTTAVGGNASLLALEEE